jgi:hypothetical protein
MRRAFGCVAAAVLGLALPATLPAQQNPVPPLAETYLLIGQLAEGETALQKELVAHPRDDQLRFGLGVIQFLRGVESLAQGLYRHGATDNRLAGLRGLIPLARLPVPENPKPQPARYEDLRKIVADFLDHLTRAEATLAGVTATDVKLPLHVGLIRLDVLGDGRASDDHSFWRIYQRLTGRSATEADARGFLVCFDRGDVHWLRGYCHLLSALAEIFLAYDGREVFEGCGHLFFQKVVTPHDYLADGPKIWDVGGGTDVADLIAFIHLIRLPVKEPNRLEAALKHLEAMIAQSREMWKHVQAETDDDHEWIPNPRQTGPIPGLRVTQERIASWLRFLDELEALLAGKKLMPFWRANDGRGVNLRRVFLEPGPLDLVLWIQGTAATPYLEKGPLTDRDVWRQLERVFGGEFLGFAAWVN